MHRYLVVPILALIALTTACRPQYDDAYTQFIRPWDDAIEARLGTGDVFHIEVYREPDLSADYTVSERGTINFPLIQAVDVINRTCGDLEVEIGQRLADGYLRTPSVSCTVLEVNSRRLSVVGQVGSAGTLNYTPSMTIVEAIAQAGGFGEAAAQNRVVVTRTVDDELLEIHVPVETIMNGRAPNFPVWPNDTIFVPEYSLFR